MAKRVFFSFHYQDVADFRANVVRNCWVVPTAQGDREDAGFFDSSLWEQSKRWGDDALKRLINTGLEGTTVTAVLIGTWTYSRRWVRYEIFKSLQRGNKLLGVHINCVPCKNRLTKMPGGNPFDFLAVRFSSDGRLCTPMEFSGTQWMDYKDLDPFSVEPRPREECNQAYKLSKWFPSYDWVAHEGSKNFASWVA